MKKITLLFALTALLVLAGCSSVSYTTDYDPEVDFSKYKAFKWFEGELPADDALGKHPLVKKRVESSVKKALEAKGFQLSENSEEADFVIILHAGTKEKMQIDTYNYGGYGYGRYGYGWGGYGGMSTTDVRYYDEATLVVDIADAEKRELVWRGSATGVVSKSKKTQEEEQENTDDLMNKILADFPPGSAQ